MNTACIYIAKATHYCKNFSIEMLGVREKVLLRISFLSTQSNKFFIFIQHKCLNEINYESSKLPEENPTI